MQFDKTSLPEDVKGYLREIYSDDGLREAFRYFDVEVMDEEWVAREYEQDRTWLECAMGPNPEEHCSYGGNIKAFAFEAGGGVWVVIDDNLVGYIGSEGECGFVARNIHEFMNIVSVWGGYLDDYWREDVLASEEAFYGVMNDPERLGGYMPELESHREALRGFIERHGFTREIYEMALEGMTVTPFLVFEATADGEYGPSYSVLRGPDGSAEFIGNGQEVLQRLIRRVTTR